MGSEDLKERRMEETSTGISTLVRTKDRPIYLERALQSLCSQTFTNIQLIIVNDGGDPDAVAHAVKGSSITDRIREVKILNNKRSKGRWAAANQALELASMQYIHIHDDDDTIAPQFYQQVIKHMENLNDNFFGVCTHITCKYEKVIQGGLRTTRERLWRRNLSGVSLGDLAIQNSIVPIGLVYKRSIHEEAGVFDSELPVLGDWEFLLRACFIKDIDILPKPLANYHIRKERKTGHANSIRGEEPSHLRYDTLIRNNFFRRRDKYHSLGVLLQIMKQQEVNRKLTLSSQPISRVIYNLIRRTLATERS